METLVAALIGWIVIQTELSAIEPPRVAFVSETEMNKLAFGSLGVTNMQLRALYSSSEKLILLRTNWDIESLNDRSELVHELVHHFQNINNIPSDCQAALERQAYHLQISWLREQGVKDPYELLQINELAIILFSRCRDTGAD